MNSIEGVCAVLSRLHSKKVQHLMGIRSRGSPRSCTPSFWRVFRSSKGRNFLRWRTALQFNFCCETIGDAVHIGEHRNGHFWLPPQTLAAWLAMHKKFKKMSV